MGPQPEKTKLIKLSVCPCGYGLLYDDIELGTEYLVYRNTVKPNEMFSLLCGGCNMTYRGRGSIMGLSLKNPNAPPALLPLELFEISLDFVQEVGENF